MDYVTYRLVKNYLGEDVVVHVVYKQHRLVTIDLENDVIVRVDKPVDHRLARDDSHETGRIVVHVEYVKKRLVKNDVGEDVIVHVSYVKCRPVMNDFV